jgi:hypothetical protein
MAEQIDSTQPRCCAPSALLVGDCGKRPSAGVVGLYGVIAIYQLVMGQAGWLTGMGVGVGLAYS